MINLLRKHNPRLSNKIFITFFDYIQKRKRIFCSFYHYRSLLIILSINEMKWKKIHNPWIFIYHYFIFRIRILILVLVMEKKHLKIQKQFCCFFVWSIASILFSSVFFFAKLFSQKQCLNQIRIWFSMTNKQTIEW